MPPVTLSEIERQIHELPLDQQLWLIESLAHGLRQSALADRADLERDLVTMAADPEIQAELRRIEAEFSPTEADGLENL
jgi:hypothetical protein